MIVNVDLRVHSHFRFRNRALIFASAARFPKGLEPEAQHSYIRYIVRYI